MSQTTGVRSGRSALCMSARWCSIMRLSRRVSLKTKRCRARVRIAVDTSLPSSACTMLSASSHGICSHFFRRAVGRKSVGGYVAGCSAGGFSRR